MTEGVFDFTRKTIFWTLAGVVITIVVFAFVLGISGYLNKLTYVPEKLRAEFISLRFANIPECFAYQDPDTGRVYPGVLDLSKFTNEQMDNCYKTEPEKGYKDYNFRLKLKKNGAEVHSNNYFGHAGDDFTLFKTVALTNSSNSNSTLISDELLIYVLVKI